MAKVDEDACRKNPRWRDQSPEGPMSERYTPEDGSSASPARPRRKFLQICEMIASDVDARRTMTSMYALGWTPATRRCAQNIRSMGHDPAPCWANMGIAGRRRERAARPFSNVQGHQPTSPCSRPRRRAILVLARRIARTTYADYMKVAAASSRCVPARPAFWQKTTKKFFVSQQEEEPSSARPGDQGQRLGLRLPAQVRPVSYDTAEDWSTLLAAGQMNGLFCPGPQHPAGRPQQGQGRGRPRQSSNGWSSSIRSRPRRRHFWEKPRRVQQHVDTKSIQTEVHPAPGPSAYCRGREGSATNSSPA